MGSARFYAALSALLFTAVCAYGGAALSSSLNSARTVVRLPGAGDKAALHGIILRREETFSTGGDWDAEDGSRLPAGTPAGAGETLLSETALFFSGTDGFEYLSPDDALMLDPARLDALLSSRPGKRGGARLVYGFDYYYAAFYEGGGYIEPGPCRVKFENTEDICRAEIITVSRDSGRTALLLRLTEGTGEQLSLRFTDAEIYS